MRESKQKPFVRVAFLFYQKMQKKEVAIVIPAYQKELNEVEKICLKRCYEVFESYPIILLIPENLDTKNYQTHFSIQEKRISAKHFTSVKAYSRLLTDPSFYALFAEYKFILIYQLDVFVFSDQLLDWCKQNYDYVGSPWVNLDWQKEFAARWHIRPNWLRKVGNGGFSLRKVKTFYWASKLFRFLTKNMKLNEDIFWSNNPLSWTPFFRIPKFDIALKFGFEQRPAFCYAQNSEKLPFGCHAWHKFDPIFWKPFFKELGYDIGFLEKTE